MKKAFFILSILSFSSQVFCQIIADHTVVDKFDDIPQYYLDQVKKMWVVYAGESHSEALRRGVELLEAMYPTYAAEVAEYTSPLAYTSSYLRLDCNTWGDLDHASGWIRSYGEEDWYSSSSAIARTKAGITYCNENTNLGLSVIAFGHCYTDGGENYISATQQYVDYVAIHSYPTKVIYTTGPNDSPYHPDEDQARYTAIRNYVAADPTLVLFDFADIICFNNDGSGPNTILLNGKYYPYITDESLTPDTGGFHMSNIAAIRLAKAMWWMLARIAGWNGETSGVPVTGITVTGAGGATAITQDNGTLALTATVQPSDATNKTVTWSIVNGTGQATINATGLVTAVANGTVTARATANDGSGVYGELVITISGQIIPVTGITVTGAGGSTTITQDNGQLQLSATVQPTDATNKTVTWSIVYGTGQATINSTGLVTAVSNGTVTARATANDGSGIVGSLVITITGQVIPVTAITVTGAGGATNIAQDNGTLALTATVVPSNATNKSVTWSLINGTGQATISASGVVTAVTNGTVTARATANDGSGVYGELVITISGQIIPVTGITVTGAGGSTTIAQDNGTLALTATVLPTNATNKTVTWSITNVTGQATINSSGVVTAVANGTVTARATANDGSGIVGSLVITITGQVIPVTGITVTGAGGSTIISSNNGQLQLTATVQPSDATNKTVTWSIVNGTGQATINSSGLVTAVSSGTVTAVASTNDGSGVQGTLVITITNQFIPVTGITITGVGGATTIAQDNGTLALTATVVPSNATNKSVTWSLINGTGQATISASGVVTAVTNGTVTARSTANDGTGIYGELVITISGQTIQVTKISVAAAKGEPIISTNMGTLQLSFLILPDNATNKTVTWSIGGGTGQASVNSNGLVTAIADGTVIVRATANDGSGVYGELTVSIINQIVLVTGITVTGEGGIATISTDNGTLRLLATVEPSNASNKSVTWSLVSGNGHADLSEEGILTARTNGNVIVRATSSDGSNIYGQIEITLTNQIVSVSSIKVKVKTKSSTTTTVNGELALEAEIFPEDATLKDIAWSVINGTGAAVISENGILKGVAPGEVIVVATSMDGSGIVGELAITINLVESIKIRYTRNEVVIQVPERLLPAKASLHNLYGTHMQSKDIDSTEAIFDISGLLPGVYVVSVYNSIVQDAAKIIVAY